MRNTVPKNPSVITDKEIDLIPIISLAFVGDAVQTLMERTRVVEGSTAKTQFLHKIVASKVNANRQAEAVKELLPLFTERETMIFKRARNVSPRNLPKHSDQNSYRISSGFEAVIGYLYLTGQEERIFELLSVAYKEEKQ